MGINIIYKLFISNGYIYCLLTQAYCGYNNNLSFSTICYKLCFTQNMYEQSTSSFLPQMSNTNFLGEENEAKLYKQSTRNPSLHNS